MQNSLYSLNTSLSLSLSLSRLYVVIGKTVDGIIGNLPISAGSEVWEGGGVRGWGSVEPPFTQNFNFMGNFGYS